MNKQLTLSLISNVLVQAKTSKKEFLEKDRADNNIWRVGRDNQVVLSQRKAWQHAIRSRTDASNISSTEPLWPCGYKNNERGIGQLCIFLFLRNRVAQSGF